MITPFFSLKNKIEMEEQKLLLQQAQNWYGQEDYARAGDFYERAIASDPENYSLYWHYGMMLSLQGKLTDAQTAWLMVMLEGNVEEVEGWTSQLVELLELEAQKQETSENFQQVWFLRQQIRELSPTCIDNLLALLNLAFRLKHYQGNELIEFKLIDYLESQSLPVNFLQLLGTITQILTNDPFHPEIINLVKACLSYARNEEQKTSMLEVLYQKTLEIGYFKRQPGIAASLAELALTLDRQHKDFVYHLSCFYQDSDRFEKGIETAKFHATLVQSLPDCIFASKGVLKSLMVTGGHWQESLDVFKKHEQLLQELLSKFPLNLTPQQTSRLFNSYFFAPYFQDNPERNRSIQNQLAFLCQENARLTLKKWTQEYQQGHQNHLLDRKRNTPLKIGYLSYCFKAHSVGWLARSLIQYHNRDRFIINGYFVANPNTSEPLTEWYVSQFDRVVKSQDSLELANAIYHDKIDILVELDSITLDTTCYVVALKPAPIQMTWLGCDASGIPSIDYFLADPYVLPGSAANYYREKIWRLPDTYLAVDGFEVGLPTLRRDRLGIEDDAIIYYSVQRGYKRHLDTVRLQLKIIKAVPNSYFLVKGASDNAAMKESFLNLADEEGLNRNRLRFLDIDLTEAIHRANLGIVDIVLDTYPYNGATTTMETIWMGIPLVTRVGEQFSARNSYTMLMNAGVKEGLAWNDAEYLEWGVRLGQNEELRQKIAWKLKKSRYTSPLWNGQKFTREVENAYQQIWQNYLHSHSDIAL